ncbi:MAG TPA: cytochrome c oxidase subunit II [Kofleriaceae bacterium]|nr:cytochrome c oxidase subunit II [Kofleriaceae bacterium]
MTSVLAIGIAMAIFGSPIATAQPAQPTAPPPAGQDGSANPTPPAVTPVAPTTGSGGPAEGSAVGGRMAGSGEGAGPMGTGSAPNPPPNAAAAGSAGSAAAPAAPAAAPVAALPWYEELANRPIEEEGNFWLPKAVNEEADSTDQMFIAVTALSIFFFVAIVAAVVYFVIKYRHRPGHKPEPSAAHNDALEITWTVIPTIICVFLFYFGWRTYVRVVTPPQKAVEIQVIGMKWSWLFTHQNGATDSDLHVPVNTPVRLVMTSTDVLHSFYAPAMRVKQDLVPRRYTYAWFKATKPGTYRLTCAEYCGTNHSQMACRDVDKESGACKRRAVVVVHAPGDYERYLADRGALNSSDPVKIGSMVYAAQCVSCHTVDGSPRIGPTFAHSFGTKIPVAEGGTVDMDENYIRESILNPTAKTHAGFPAGTMPSFEGRLKEKEINGMIEYIKSLK